MQTYCLRMFNFMRFGEKGNSIVFDLTSQEKKDLKDGKITMDQIYDRVMKDPVKHVMEVKRRGLERLLAISGIVDGNEESSNGAGKSTLLEGMCYARYERIVRRTAQTPDKIEKAGLSVVTKIDGKYPPNMQESWVEELCEIGDKLYRIRRGREFSKSQKSHTPIMELECIYGEASDSMMSHRTGDTKSNLDEIMTMDYDLFVNSQMFGQNDAGKYLTGTDKTKKEMLISLLRLENIVSGCLENIRRKKNSQEKKIDIIKATIDLVEKSFCKKYQELTKIATEQLGAEIVDSILSNLNKTSHQHLEASKSIDLKIQDIDLKIGELLKSDKIQKVESIRDEGRKISKDKKDKEQSMASQIEEWEKLSKDSKSTLAKKNDQDKILTEKLNKLMASISVSKVVVSSFDLIKYQEIIQKITKAKKIKDEIELNLTNSRNSFLETSNALAIANSKLSDTSGDLEKMNSQLEKIGGDGSFVCSECKSKVSKEHIALKVNELKESHVIKRELVEALKNKIAVQKQSVVELEYKVKRIGEILSLESKTNSEKNNFENAKSKIVDIENQIKENKESSNSNKIEIVEIENKISLYCNKIVDIKKMFEQEILILKSKIENLIIKLKQAEEDAKVVSGQLENLKIEKISLEKQKSKEIEQYGSALKDYEHFEKQKLELESKKNEHLNESKNLNRILILEDIYGLDGIQTRIVKKYLPLLNIYIKEYLDILSDGLITIKMIINDKSKVDMIISGGTSESYEMLSGGEKTIIKLAVNIGLSLLAFSRATQKPELICLDEVFGSLDAGRTRNVFKVLNKLNDKFSRIIIISHNLEINNKIRSKIIVEKSGGIMGLSEIKRIE